MIGTSALAATSAFPSDMLGDLPQSGGARSIEQTGKHVEALFLSMLLKEMRQTLGEDGLFAGDTSDVHGGLFDMYLGKHLADSGGVGMADALTRLLPREKANAIASTAGKSPA